MGNGRRPSAAPERCQSGRPVVEGKFVHIQGERFLIKGVTYGTFAPDARGRQFSRPARIAEDFALMSRFGINTVRTYTPPPLDLLDEAARWNLRVMVGLAWSQHVAFLNDRSLRRDIRRDVVREVRALGSHPASLLFAIGNEIPAPVVRWHGPARVERFLRELYDEAKWASPESLFTYVNYPPTEFLDLPFLDVCAFNIYLHGEADQRAYLARLQHVAGHRPLLLAEAGADSLRLGEEKQAAIAASHLRSAFTEGACGAIAFAWTDEWWRGGYPVQDWAFGLVDAERRPKLALHAVAHVFAAAPFREDQRHQWPKVSVVVCACNAADTLDDCLSSLARLTYPNYEVLLVNDGSRDATGAIGRRHRGVIVIDIPNGGLSAARNVGVLRASGEIVAYTDADTRVDPEWLTYLVQPFLTSDVVGSGGPNVVPADDPWLAQCVARAPGGPTHVMLDDRIAEHVPGCNFAFRRDALLAIGGFNPIYLRAGDDVDVCWRLQKRGWKIGFAPSALVWHHHRSSIGAYWRQQVGYGEGEAWLMAHHPDKFVGPRAIWQGRIYSPLPWVRSCSPTRVNAGACGTASFPSVYRTEARPLAYLPHMGRWQVGSFALALIGVLMLIRGDLSHALVLVAAGLAGLGLTVARCVQHALASDVDSLAPISGCPRRISRALYRAAIAWLHFIQPLARLRGRLRGWLSPPPPHVRSPHSAARSVSMPSVDDIASALLLMRGEITEARFWGESWTSRDSLLQAIAGRLRRSLNPGTVEIDDGWWINRDVSVAIGRFVRLDLRALVEDHGSGRCLFRLGARLRPTRSGAVALFTLATWLMCGATLGWPIASAASLTAGVALIATVMWQTARVHRAVGHAVTQAASEASMQPIRRESRAAASGVAEAQTQPAPWVRPGATRFLSLPDKKLPMAKRLDATTDEIRSEGGVEPPQVIHRDPADLRREPAGGERSAAPPR